MKRAPVVVEAVELGEDDVLGGGVDDERAVAALAALARLDDALAARGVLGEDARSPSDGATAGAQPVGTSSCPGIGCGGHMPHILGACPIRSTASPSAQREVVAHRGGPLVVARRRGDRQDPRARAPATPGSRPTGALAPEQVLALTSSAPRPPTRCARGSRTRSSAAFDELHVHTVARLLRAAAARRGARGRARPVRRAGRARRPARDAARARRRADAALARLPRQPGRAARRRSSRGSTGSRRRWSPPTRSARWAAALPAGDRARRARARVRRLYATHDRMLREQGALDAGDLVLRALALLERAPRARARRGALAATCSSTTSQDLALRAACASSSRSAPSTAG